LKELYRQRPVILANRLAKGNIPRVPSHEWTENLFAGVTIIGNEASFIGIGGWATLPKELRGIIFMQLDPADVYSVCLTGRVFLQGYLWCLTPYLAAHYSHKYEAMMTFTSRESGIGSTRRWDSVSRKYHDNGELFYEEHHLNGMRHGYCWKFNQNGFPVEMTHFQEDKSLVKYKLYQDSSVYKIINMKGSITYDLNGHLTDCIDKSYNYNFGEYYSGGLAWEMTERSNEKVEMRFYFEYGGLCCTIFIKGQPPTIYEISIYDQEGKLQVLGSNIYSMSYPSRIEDSLNILILPGSSMLPDFAKRIVESVEAAHPEKVIVYHYLDSPLGRKFADHLSLKPTGWPEHRVKHYGTYLIGDISYDEVWFVIDRIKDPCCPSEMDSMYKSYLKKCGVRNVICYESW
jgi:hypothetical protein